MQALSAFYSRILPYLPGCSEPLVDQVLVDAAIDFCENSLAIRQNLDSFNTRIGAIEYDLDPPSSQYTIARVMSVNVAGDELAPVMVETVRNDLSTVSAKPRGFYTDRVDSTLVLRLTPPPDAVYEVKVIAALRPARSATQLDNDLLNLWVEPVTHAAIARAMMIPDQPFTNPAMAATMAMSAAKLTATSRIESNYGLIRGSMRSRSRPFV